MSVENIVIAAVIWVAMSFLLGVFIGKWIAGPKNNERGPS
jgi:uncharacterized protein YneF (UPF0154 family)